MRLSNLRIALLSGGLSFLMGCGGAALDVGYNNIAFIQAPRPIADRELLAEVAREFYKTYPDDYDMLVLWAAPEFAPGNSSYLPVKNDVPGIGYQHLGDEFFDKGAEFGSNRLQGIIWMGPDWISNAEEGLGPRSVLGILAQETGHRWGSLVRFRDPDLQTDSTALLSLDALHWNFYLDTGGSPMGGNQWEALGGSLFQGEPVEEARFCQLDLYLMGLLPAEGVGPLQLLLNPQAADGIEQARGARFIQTVTDPLVVQADLMEISIDQIIEVEGRRDPGVGFNAKNLHQAWIYVYQGSSESSAAELNMLQELQDRWSHFFNQTTGGLGSMSTTLF